MKQKKIKAKLKKDYSNYIIIAFALLIITILLVGQNEAKMQNKELLNDHLLYQEIQKNLEAESTENLISGLEELHKKYYDDYNITYRLGFAYLSNGNYEAALIMYSKSLDLNPYLSEDKDFMYYFAVTLSNVKRYDDAVLVIDRLLTLPMDEAFLTTVTELKDSINKMKGSTT